MLYEPGQKYLDRNGNLWEITDRFTVNNIKGEIVRVYYSAKCINSSFDLINGDVPATTVFKGVQRLENCERTLDNRLL